MRINQAIMTTPEWGQSFITSIQKTVHGHWSANRTEIILASLDVLARYTRVLHPYGADGVTGSGKVGIWLIAEVHILIYLEDGGDYLLRLEEDFPADLQQSWEQLIEDNMRRFEYWGHLCCMPGGLTTT
jgi:hypothetical protein